MTEELLPPVFPMVSPEAMRRIMPYASPAKILVCTPFLNSAMAEFEIDTPTRQAFFLPQVAHESGSLTYTAEIASGAAYDNRADLGNTRPEAIEIAKRNNTTPGRWFKGHGFIQVTGYDNHLRCSLDLFGDDRVVHNPMMLCRKDLACRSAGWFWWRNGLNKWADLKDFDGVCDMVNRGRKTAKVGDANGYNDRVAYHTRALKEFLC